MFKINHSSIDGTDGIHEEIGWYRLQLIKEISPSG
jgi:hypothetical protein